MYVRYLDDVMALIIGLFSCSFFLCFFFFLPLPVQWFSAWGTSGSIRENERCYEPQKKTIHLPWCVDVPSLDCPPTKCPSSSVPRRVLLFLWINTGRSWDSVLLKIEFKKKKKKKEKKMSNKLIHNEKKEKVGVRPLGIWEKLEIE